jgi:transcriptional regulator with XRE-family HTH domain
MTFHAVVRHHAAMPAKLPPKPTSSIRQTFARRLEAARVAAGYPTMREFAEALAIAGARYRRWEAAETEPDLMHLAKIAKLTGISLDILIGGDRRAAS